MADVQVPTVAVVTPASGDTVLGVQGGAVKRMAKGPSFAQLSASTGAALVGHGGGTVSDALDNAASLTADQTFTGKQTLQDDAGAAASVVNIEHYGAGDSQSYGLDIHNNPGARSALVVHQYSNAAPALQLDNTDTSTMVVLRNTNNPTKNPSGAASGTSATGNFLICADTNGTQWLAIFGRGELSLTPPADATGHAIEVIGNASSSKRLFKGTMNGPGHGVEIVAASGSTGWFPILVTGYNYGPRFTTSQDGGRTLEIQKNGTGLGEAVRISNEGTGQSISFRKASAEVFAITAAGLPQWSAPANEQTTVGGAGAASALPATPSKYLKVVGSDGATYVIPAYAAA